MALLVRARLSSLDDDDDDAATASSVSSGAASPPFSPSPPLVSPTVRRAAVLGAPRVAAQLSSSAEDEEGEAFDDATDYGEEEEGDVLQEVSNGFFRVARVPPPPPGEGPTSADEKPAGSASASDSEYFGASEGSVGEGFAIARRTGLEGAAGVIVVAKGTGVESSLDGSLQSSSSVISVLDDAAAFGDLVNVSDGFVLPDGNKRDDENVGAEAVKGVMPEPTMADTRGTAGGAMHLVDAFEGKDGGSEHEVAELPPVVDVTEEAEANIELRNGHSDAKDGTPKQEVVTDVEDASTEYVATIDGTSDFLEFPENVDRPHSIADGVSSEVDGENYGDYDDNGEPTSMPTKDAAELIVKELEDNVPASKGSRFGLDDSDDDEVNGKEIELVDYAALAELLRVANRSPEQGKANVFPIESPESQQPSPTVVSVPRTSVASTPVLDVDHVVADLESQMTDEEKKLYRKVDMVRIKYLRLVHRLGYDPEHHVAIQVLYRLSLVEGFRRIRMANHSFELENAWKRALLLEAEGIEVLEFSCNVLVLGKTGVGKSATINSIFGEDKSKTDAFLPATSSVKEIAGVVGGVKFRVIDTPGLGTTGMGEKSNRKVLNSIKKYIKRCPPDIVLYVDRIDTQRKDASDLLLLRGITKVLGPSIWSKTVITFTHSAAAPPEGPGGSPMKYEMVVDNRTNALQQSIWQAANEHRIGNAVALVENHHLCQRNTEDEKVLPNGLIWRRFLLLLCYSHKMIGEIDSLSTRRAASASLFGLRLQMPPLPYFLSSLLQSREHPRLANDQNVHRLDSDVDLDEFLDEDQEDEEYDYDQLPPFKPLSKSQVAKLSKEQQKLYFDEYDYRTKLLQKKQLKEQLRSLKEIKEREGNSHDVLRDNDHPDDEYDTDRSPIPDWALPSSFDSDDPVYRYRCLEPTSNLLVRPVTNPDGWDHDCGFDGVGLQHGLDVANTCPSSLWVQINKDKQEFTIHLESSILARHGEDVSTLAGFDIQTMMEQVACTLRGETKFKNIDKNTTTGGLSMTFLGDTMVTGAKVEDNLSINNRLTLAANTGAVSMRGETAYGVNMEATLREKNYPIGQGLATLGASLVRWRKQWTVSANLYSQFSVGRTSNMTVHLDVNNKLTGCVRIKANTSEQMKITLLGICSMAMYLWNKMHPCADHNYE